VPNQYEQALTAVMEIIQDYDSDHLFPVLGFGARLPPHGQVSHEFFVNMHRENPYCSGISGTVQNENGFRTCGLERETLYLNKLSMSVVNS
jgi:hypothetical protein